MHAINTKSNNKITKVYASSLNIALFLAVCSTCHLSTYDFEDLATDNIKKLSDIHNLWLILFQTMSTFTSTPICNQKSVY